MSRATPGAFRLLRTARHVLVGRRPAIMFIVCPRGCPYTLRTRRNGTARCPGPFHSPRTYYRTCRAQKTRRVLVRGSGSTMNRHTHTQPQNARRATNEGRERCTHTADTLRARRGGRRERSGRHTPNSNLNATARLQNAPGPDRGAGDGTAFSMTATARPRDGGTVAAVYTWNSQSMDWPRGRRAV